VTKIWVALSPSHWVQVSADINPDWAHRRLIADAEADSVTIVIEQTPDVNSVVHIAAVIEDYAKVGVLGLTE
jgi:hypothetical protein